ncbi:MAG: PLP-dependent lyase/thiolase [Candidatus Magasanikbacteria bacterium]
METLQQSQEKLAKILNIPALYFKREDMHRYGSHKGRSIPKMIEFYKKQGQTHFCISSSGNAALAGALFVKENNQKDEAEKISLHIFVGNNIPEEKLSVLKKLLDTHITLEQTERPKQSAFQMEKEGIAKNLRQSTDDIALLGYESLAEELLEIPNLQAVFIPTSSGTTAEALATKLGKNIQIHIVQTTKCHPIAGELDTDFTPTEESCAMAIVDLVAHRKKDLVEKIAESHGSGWVVNDNQIEEAQKQILEETNESISPNSALSFAGLQKALQKGKTFDGSVVCIMTGK